MLQTCLHQTKAQAYKGTIHEALAATADGSTATAADDADTSRPEAYDQATAITTAAVSIGQTNDDESATSDAVATAKKAYAAASAATPSKA